MVKDRVLVHNPVMALYTAEGYYANLMRRFRRRMNPPARSDFSFGGAGYVWGWWVWNKNFPWNRAGSAGRPAGGPQLTMEVPGGSRGLPGVCPGEQGGLMDRPLLPEGMSSRLRRTFPVERLRSQGCWPVTGGKCR